MEQYKYGPLVYNTTDSDDDTDDDDTEDEVVVEASTSFTAVNVSAAARARLYNLIASWNICINLRDIYKCKGYI